MLQKFYKIIWLMQIGNSISTLSVRLLGFIYFGGFYFLLLFFVKQFGLDTRLLAIPLRILMILLLLVIFRLKFKKGITFSLFHIFSISYSLCLIYLAIFHNPPFLDVVERMFYYLSFNYLPFVLVASGIPRFSFIEDFIKYSIIGCILFILYFIISGSLNEAFILGRGSDFFDRENEVYISPLSVASTGAFLLLSSIFIRDNGYVVRIVSFILGLGGIIIGSSRGSIFGLLVISLLYILQVNIVSFKGLYRLFGIIVVIYLMYHVANYYELEIIQRIELLLSGESVANSNIRLKIWVNSFDLAKSSWFTPISVDSGYFGYRPHNVFLEVLLITGILGLFMFSTFLGSIFFGSGIYNSQFLLMLAVYSLVVLQFSGTLHSASWLFMSLALMKYSNRFETSIRNT